MRGSELLGLEEGGGALGVQLHFTLHQKWHLVFVILSEMLHRLQESKLFCLTIYQPSQSPTHLNQSKIVYLLFCFKKHLIGGLRSK